MSATCNWPVRKLVLVAGNYLFCGPLTLLPGTMQHGIFTCWQLDGRRFEQAAAAA